MRSINFLFKGFPLFQCLLFVTVMAPANALSSQNIGINTDNPMTTLDVNGTITADTFFLGDSESSITKYVSSYMEMRNKTNIFLNAGFGGSPNNDISFKTNNQVMALFDGSSKNFAMGTFAPKERIDINGAIKIQEAANQEEGTIQFDGADFMGRAGNQWKSLTSQTSAENDTSRTLVNDLAIARAICNCPNISPILVNGMRDAGYSDELLLNSGISPSSLLHGGVDSDFILDNYPGSLAELIADGYPLQNILDNDLYTYMQILDGGASATDLIGLSYQGGLICYIDENDTFPFEGIIVTEYRQSDGAIWGCQGTETGANEIGLDGAHYNTNAILNDCSTPGIAAEICEDLDPFENWSLPTSSILQEVYNNLVVPGKHSYPSDVYWCSNEQPDYPDVRAATIDLSSGLLEYKLKQWSIPSVLAIKYFSN